MVRSLCSVAVMERVKAGGGIRAGEDPRPDSPAQLARAWVERSCAAQGIPVALADVGSANAVAVLLTAGRKPVKVSDPPSRIDATGVKAVPASDCRTDSDPVQEHGGDSPLPGSSEVRPLAS